MNTRINISLPQELKNRMDAYSRNNKAAGPWSALAREAFESFLEREGESGVLEAPTEFSNTLQKEKAGTPVEESPAPSSLDSPETPRPLLFDPFQTPD